MSSVAKPYVTAQEYLEIERKAEFKSEYFHGEMFAMSGASRQHNLIASNLNRESGNQLRDRPCEVYQSDMRVKVNATGLYTYPDLVIVCNDPEFEDDHVDTLLNPTVVMEVLSESTEGYDRGKKFEHYRRVSSIREYLLVAQDRFHVEVHRRQEDGHWLLWETDSENDAVELHSVDCRLKMSDIYAKVQFPNDDQTSSGS